MKPLVYHSLFASKTNNAHHITFDNGCDYVVKLYKSKENKALINEWLAYCLARYMALPVPYSYLIEMPEAFVSAIPERGETEYTTKQFASAYIKNSKNGHEVKAPNLFNAPDLAKIIVFDYWLYNTDRTRKNILLQEQTAGNYFLWAIDHAEILGSFSWTINDLENLPQTVINSATHRMMAEFIEKESEFKAQIKIIQSIPTQLLEEILSFVPPDWNLSEEEQHSLIKALNFRRYNVLPNLIGKFVKSVYRPIHQLKE
jgi:hypothetical protein